MRGGARSNRTSSPAPQDTILAAIDEDAEQLGDTRTVCRNSHIYPDVVDGYADRSLGRAWSRRGSGHNGRGLRADERFVLSYLRSGARRPGSSARAA